MSVTLQQGAASTAWSVTLPFNARVWLDMLATIGGGYALGSDRRAFLLVDRCDGGHLTAVMRQITGQPERVEAVHTAIERRQIGEA